VTIKAQHIQNSVYVYNMAEATASVKLGYQEIVFAAFFVGASNHEKVP
jgi:stringent starvation protein B